MSKIQEGQCEYRNQITLKRCKRSARTKVQGQWCCHNRRHSLALARHATYRLEVESQNSVAPRD